MAEQLIDTPGSFTVGDELTKTSLNIHINVSELRRHVAGNNNDVAFRINVGDGPFDVNQRCMGDDGNINGL